jgi:proteasome alpha subunit
MMGYDRAITMFSPDGRLLQVEYAKKTVKLGNTAIGMVCNDGVLLVTDKRIADQLIVAEAVEKVFQIDEHMISTAAGIISDGRVLIERGQTKAQQYKVTYDSPVDVLSVVKDIADLKQMCTQSGGLRPFGVVLLLAGVDQTGATLYKTDPTGIYNQYKATAIGEGEDEAKEILRDEYDPSMTIDEGLELSVKILKETLSEKLEPKRIDTAYVTTEEERMEKFSEDKIKDVLDEV